MTEPVQVAGFNLQRNHDKRSFDSIRGKECFTNLKSMNLVGLGALDAAVQQLPTAEAVGILSEDQGEPVHGYQLIRDARTHSPFSMRTDDYEVVQYDAMLGPIMEVVQSRGLHIASTLGVTNGGARLRGATVIGDAEWTVPCLHDDGDDVMLGFRFRAAHDGTSAVNADPFAVRTVCVNDNLWGAYLPTVSIRHTKNAQHMASAFEKWLDDYFTAWPRMQDRLQEANETPLDLPDLTLAALGVGLSPRAVAEWRSQPRRWEPKLAANAWLGYNSLTGYLTHGSRSQGWAIGTRDNALQAAARILDAEALQKAVVRGRDIADALKTKANAQRKAGDRLTVPTIYGVTA